LYSSSKGSHKATTVDWLTTFSSEHHLTCSLLLQTPLELPAKMEKDNNFIYSTAKIQF
jgi:hypothetical protein